MKNTKINNIYLARPAPKTIDPISLIDMQDEHILCTFARSYDKSNLSNNQIHLITSVYKCTPDQRLDDDFAARNIEYHYKRYEERLNSLNKPTRQLVICKIYNVPKSSKFNSFEEFLKLEPGYGLKLDEGYKAEQRNENLLIFRASIITILQDLFINSEKRLLTMLFGSVYSEEKSYNIILNDTLFVFVGFNHFFMIKAILNLYNIQVSGGGVTNRFCISSVQANLISFLHLVGLYDFFENKGVYESYLDLTSTRSIDSTFNKLPKITNMVDYLQRYGNNPYTTIYLADSWNNEVVLYFYIFGLYIFFYSERMVIKLTTEINNLKDRLSKSNLSITDKTKLNLVINKLIKTESTYREWRSRLKSGSNISDSELLNIQNEFLKLHPNILSNNSLYHNREISQTVKNLAALEELRLFKKKTLRNPGIQNKGTRFFSTNAKHY